MRTVVAAAVLALLTACQRAPSAEEVAAQAAANKQEAEAAIATWIRDMERRFEAGAVDSLGPMLTADYHALVPNMPVLAGRDKTVEWIRAALATGTYVERHTVEAVEVSGNTAVTRGRYVMTFTPSASAPRGTRAMVDTGKFLWHFRKTDGEWLLAAAAGSSDKPATP